MTSTKRHKTAERLSLLLVILLSGIVVIFIGRQVLAYANFPFDFDEANHANGALALFLELRAGDIGGFFSELYSQGFYPPGFSWLKAVAFLIFGPSALTGRMFSLVCLFLACIVIYFLAREIDEGYGWLAGLVAVALTWTIQPLLINSAQVMMEAPGLLATFSFLWVYVRALKRPSPFYLIAGSLLLALTFFTKFTYGVIVVGSVGVMELSLLIDARHAQANVRQFESAWHPDLRRWLYLLGPFALILLVWFIGPGNLGAFGAYATAQPPDQPWITAENLFFYPRSIILHQTPSPIFALFTLAGLIWAGFKWRSPRVRLLLLYFLVGMAVMTVNLPKNPRFIATIVPAAHILTGLLISWLAANRHSEKMTMRIASVGGMVLFAAAILLSLPTLKERFTTYPSLLHVEYETDPQANEIMSWISATIPAGQRFHILNYWDQLSPQLIAWHLATNTYPAQPDLRFAQTEMPAHLVLEPTPANIAALRQEITAGDAAYVVLFEGGPWGLPFWPEYTEAMADILEPVAREEFQVVLIDTGNWQDEHLLQQAEWEQSKGAEPGRVGDQRHHLSNKVGNSGNAASRIATGRIKLWLQLVGSLVMSPNQQVKCKVFYIYLLCEPAAIDMGSMIWYADFVEIQVVTVYVFGVHSSNHTYL